MGRCESCKKEKRKDLNVSFHKFPTDKALCAIWVNNMNRKDFTLRNDSVLCSDHFDATCFEQKFGITRLKKNSFPTIFERTNVEDHNAEYSTVSTKKVCKGLLNLSRTNAQCTQSVDEFCDSQLSNTLDICMAQASTSKEENVYFQKEILEKDVRECQSPLPTNMSAIVQTPRTSHRQRSTTHDHRYNTTPTTYKRKMYSLRQKLEITRKSNKLLKERVKRLKRTVTSLKEVVSRLKDSNLIEQNALYCLSAFEDTPLELFSRMVENSKRKTLSRKQYPQNLRAFALTLHFYSPKAYNYVRKTFNLALPHPDVLRTWYSNIDAEPSFTEESFNTVQHKVEEARQKNENIVCALMLDEISIKVGTQRGRDGKVRGFIDIGVDAEDGDNTPLARDFLVLMIVPLNEHWKLPIGYFLINGLSAKEKANLIIEALIRLHNVEVRVCSLTMDGPIEHFSVAKLQIRLSVFCRQALTFFSLSLLI